MKNLSRVLASVLVFVAGQVIACEQATLQSAAKPAVEQSWALWQLIAVTLVGVSFAAAALRGLYENKKQERRVGVV